MKAWSAGEIRALARQTIDGRKTMTTARGAYFRAVIETAQSDLGGKADQAAQLAAVKAVHRRFYPVVQEAIATDEIILKDGLPRKSVALERNRRLNFARSAYGTIKRWLRAQGHDLMKLDAKTVTKSQLLAEAPPTRKHALTQERVRAKAGKLIDSFLVFAKQVAKADPEQSVEVVNQAIDQLVKMLAGNARATTDAQTAAEESRLLRTGGQVFWPVSDLRTRKVA